MTREEFKENMDIVLDDYCLYLKKQCRVVCDHISKGKIQYEPSKSLSLPLKIVSALSLDYGERQKKTIMKKGEYSKLLEIWWSCATESRTERNKKDENEYDLYR